MNRRERRGTDLNRGGQTCSEGQQIRDECPQLNKYSDEELDRFVNAVFGDDELQASCTPTVRLGRERHERRAPAPHCGDGNRDPCVEVTMIELFQVSTIVKEHRGHKDVPFSWFRNERAKDRPYAELIKDYRPTDENAFYSELCVDEFFTKDEAEILKGYLGQNHGDAGVNTIKAVKLPLPSNVMGIGAMPVGGNNDFYMLDKEENYSLPFRVWGYLDLRGCQRVDGSGVYPW
jgi:hypothetical protein